ncbi:hypothetical protein [Hyella patelloides]|nr:hypothetical protein [Hyella patelloides]
MTEENSEFDLLYPAEKDIVPPWEKFPTYEHHSLGWRMGDGEDYKCNWWNFVDSLPSEYESRLKYLKRNRPAPINQFYKVLWVLYPDCEEDKEYQESQAEIAELL